MLIKLNNNLWYVLLKEDLKIFSLIYEKNLYDLFYLNIKILKNYKMLEFNGSFSYIENEDWILLKENQFSLLLKNLGISKSSPFFYEEPFYVESRSAMKYLHISKHWHPQRKKFFYRYLKVRKKDNISPLYLKKFIYFFRNKNIFFSEKFIYFNRFKNILSFFFTFFSKYLFDNFYFDHKLKLSKMYNSYTLNNIWNTLNLYNNLSLNLENHLFFNYKDFLFKTLRPKKNKSINLKLILSSNFYKNSSISNVYLGSPKKVFESFTRLHYSLADDPFFSFKSQFILKQSRINNFVFGNKWNFIYRVQKNIFNNFFFKINSNFAYNFFLINKRKVVCFNFLLNKHFSSQNFFFNLMSKFPKKNMTYFFFKIYKNQIFYNLHINFFNLTVRYFLINIDLINFYFYAINIKSILKNNFLNFDFYDIYEKSYTCNFLEYLSIFDKNLYYNLNLILLFKNTNNQFSDSLFEIPIRFFEINRSRLLIKRKLDDHTIMYIESINHLKFAYNYYSNKVLDFFRIAVQIRYTLISKFKISLDLNLNYNLYLNYILNLSVFPKNRFRFEKIKFRKDTKPILYKKYHIYPKKFVPSIMLYFDIYFYYPFIDKFFINTFNKMNYNDEIRLNQNDSMGLFAISRLHLKNHRVRFRNFLKKRKLFLIWLKVKKIYLGLSILLILILILII